MHVATAICLLPSTLRRAHLGSKHAHQVLIDILPLEQGIQRSLGIQLDACFIGLTLTPPIATVAAQRMQTSPL